MKAILALGNPGDRYRDTRHNVGWWLADRLVRRWGLPPFRPVGKSARTGGEVSALRIELLKPLTYVNRSGDAIAPLVRSGALDPRRDLLVLVDDVWLPIGRVRLRRKGSPGGHNGLGSVESAVGGEEYSRLRLGVDRPGDERIDLAAWVLAPMNRADEESTLASLDRAVEAVECWLTEGIEEAMNRFNRN